MALRAKTSELRARVRDQIGVEVFDSYLADLRVVEVSSERIVLEVRTTLAREAFRRCGPALAGTCRQLFGSRRVLLAGDGEWFDLAEGKPCGGAIPEPRNPATGGERRPGPGRLRQRSGPCGQPGIRERLGAQESFQLAASLPRTASQAFGRHSPEEPLESSAAGARRTARRR